MKLSRTVAYAVQATLQLAEAESLSPVPCSRLAAEGHLPERFLLQILRHLVNRGILHSTRGVEGGYRLDRQPSEISLLDVMEAIEGPQNWELPAGHEEATQFASRLRDALDQISQNFRRDLEAIKLSDLMSPPLS